MYDRFEKIPATIENNPTIGPRIIMAVASPGLTALSREPNALANCSTNIINPMQPKNAFGVFCKPKLLKEMNYFVMK